MRQVILPELLYSSEPWNRVGLILLDCPTPLFFRDLIPLCCHLAWSGQLCTIWYVLLSSCFKVKGLGVSTSFLPKLWCAYIDVSRPLPLTSSCKYRRGKARRRPSIPDPSLEALTDGKFPSLISPPSPGQICGDFWLCSLSAYSPPASKIVTSLPNRCSIRIKKTSPPTNLPPPPPRQQGCGDILEKLFSDETSKKCAACYVPRLISRSCGGKRE